MNISDCQEGYKILSAAAGKRVKLEDVEINYEHHFCNMKSDIFLKACHNLAKSADHIPSVYEIIAEYRELLPHREKNDDFDLTTIEGCPQELKDMMANWAKEHDVNEVTGNEEDDLPF